MSDAAYFSAFSEPPLEAHARRLRSIDREGEEKRYKRTDRERERGEGMGKVSFIIPLGEIRLATQYRGYSEVYVIKYTHELFASKVARCAFLSLPPSLSLLSFFRRFLPILPVRCYDVFKVHS